RERHAAEVAGLRVQLDYASAERESLSRDLAEALEQQTVTGDILRTIATAPTESQRVLDELAASMLRLIDMDLVTISQLDGDRIVNLASGLSDRMSTEQRERARR